MINGYFIRSINNEEVLYLNFNFSYEFSSFDFMAKREKIQEVVRNFIRDNKIVFKGATVLLVSGGVLFGSIILNTPNFSGGSINSIKPIESSVTNDDMVSPNGSIKLDDNYSINIDSRDLSSSVLNNDEVKVDIIEPTDSFNESQSIVINKVEPVKEKVGSIKEKVEPVKESVSQSNVSENTVQPKREEKVEIKDEVKAPVHEEVVDNNIYVSVRRGGSIVKIELEDYITGVVGAEMPASFNVEALKAQAVIARTYALKAISRGSILSDNESSQSYKSNDQLKSLWGSSFNAYFNKVRGAVDSTRGVYLTYNGNYIEAVNHSTSNGRTEDARNVWGNSFPYLVSVSSQYDNSNPSFLKSVSFSYSDISKKLDVIVTSDTDFIINGRTSGDRVASISVGEVTFSGVEFRNKLGLRSADFDIEKNDSGITIFTRGYGHGVGMSQYGANGMAKAGSGYRDILLHYYPGVSFKTL